jgi:hypothetical protein
MRLILNAAFAPGEKPLTVTHTIALSCLVSARKAKCDCPEGKTIHVAEGVSFASGLGLPDGGVGECHVKLLEVSSHGLEDYALLPFRQRKTGTRVTPISGLKNGLKNSGCPWISVASGRL